jgi:hypothetical protein
MISIVQYSRNDNHGGNMLQRMKYSFYTNIYLLEKHKIKSEIIMVDYNTQEDKDNLYKLLKIENLDYVKVRHIVVPSDIHHQFKDSDKLPMNNMVARNIGIRRAKGDYILSTGVDVILSEELVQKFNNLSNNTLYRTHRYDVNRCLLEESLESEELLKKCEKNIIDVHFNTSPGKFMDTDIPVSHTYNCGDFQLAHKDIWNRLNSYPEIDLMGTHSDAIFNYMSYLDGNKEEVLKEKIYHIDHDSRWLKPIYTHILRNWRVLYLKYGEDILKFKDKYYALAKVVSDDYEDKSFLEENNIDILSIDDYKNIVLDMYYKKRSLSYNDENWGMKNSDFMEVVY